MSPHYFHNIDKLLRVWGRQLVCFATERRRRRDSLLLQSATAVFRSTWGGRVERGAGTTDRLSEPVNFLLSSNLLMQYFSLGWNIGIQRNCQLLVVDVQYVCSSVCPFFVVYVWFPLIGKQVLREALDSHRTNKRTSELFWRGRLSTSIIDDPHSLYQKHIW